jgi:GNAT superfamily N-acetyltransferase
MFRLATMADVPEMEKLLESSVARLSTGYYTTEQITSSLQYIFGIDTQLIRDQTYYIYERDGQIAACGGWSRRNTLYGGDQYKNTEDPLLDPAENSARIRAFFVNPNYARQGIGRQMILKCEEAAKQEGFSSFELGSTLPGVPLYRAMGYRELERHDITLPDGVLFAVIKMVKP